MSRIALKTNSRFPRVATGHSPGQLQFVVSNGYISMKKSQRKDSWSYSLRDDDCSSDDEVSPISIEGPEHPAEPVQLQSETDRLIAEAEQEEIPYVPEIFDIGQVQEPATLKHIETPWTQARRVAAIRKRLHDGESEVREDTLTSSTSLRAEFKKLQTDKEAGPLKKSLQTGAKPKQLSAGTTRSVKSKTQIPVELSKHASIDLNDDQAPAQSVLQRSVLSNKSMFAQPVPASHNPAPTLSKASTRIFESMPPSSEIHICSAATSEPGPGDSYANLTTNRGPVPQIPSLSPPRLSKCYPTPRDTDASSPLTSSVRSDFSLGGKLTSAQRLQQWKRPSLITIGPSQGTRTQAVTRGGVTLYQPVPVRPPNFSINSIPSARTAHSSSPSAPSSPLVTAVYASKNILSKSPHPRSDLRTEPTERTKIDQPASRPIPPNQTKQTHYEAAAPSGSSPSLFSSCSASSRSLLPTSVPSPPSWSTLPSRSRPSIIPSSSFYGSAHELDPTSESSVIARYKTQLDNTINPPQPRAQSHLQTRGIRRTAFRPVESTQAYRLRQQQQQRQQQLDQLKVSQTESPTSIPTLARELAIDEVDHHHQSSPVGIPSPSSSSSPSRSSIQSPCGAGSQRSGQSVRFGTAVRSIKTTLATPPSRRPTDR